jgi:hypothetical protein
VSQWPCFKQALATNQPAAISPEKAAKALFTSPLEQKGAKKFGTTKKKQYLCTAFNSKAIFNIDGKGSLGEWLKPPVC